MTTLLRATIEYGGLPGMPGFTTLYADESNITASAFLDAIGDQWDTFGTNHFSADLTWDVHGVMDEIDSTTGLITGTQTGGTDRIGSGSNGGDVLPFSTQGLVQLRTGTYFTGRELRGRIFLPGFTEADSTDGAPIAALVAGFPAEMHDLAIDALVVYSPTKHQWASVTAVALWSQWASLRSRRP